MSDLRDTDKSRYFAITEFNNCFIIRSPSLFSGSEAICHFHARAIARRRKARFPLRMCRILFVAKHSWTVLRMSTITMIIICRQLFAGHVVSSRPMKRMKKNEKFASNDNSQSSDDVRPDPTHHPTKSFLQSNVEFCS